MRLRRVTEHVKAQNRTAVVLDFLIVVAGVFVGVQVNEWWLSRLDARKERAYLLEPTRTRTGHRRTGERHEGLRRNRSRDGGIARGAPT